MVDIAFEQLRDAIVSGELKPGTRLHQDAIAEELGISRMPLREALRRLDELGFVTIRHHRGTFVTEPSIDEIRDTYAVRTLLESASAAEAARNIGNERLERLREILSDAREALEAEDGPSLAEQNALFHLTAHEASENEVLMRMINDLTMHCQRYRLQHARLTDRAAEALYEHEQILEAWSEHDPREASHWIEVNLRNSAAALIKSVQAAKLEQDIPDSDVHDKRSSGEI